MTDNTTDMNASQDNQVTDAPQATDVDTIKALQAEVEALRKHTSELLAETKSAKQKARDEAHAKEQAKLEKAKKEGDYEQLLKSSEQQRAELKNQLEQLQHNISSEKVQTHAMKLATELADGPNAKILAKFIGERLKYTDEGMKVLDSAGNLTVLGDDYLMQEFSSSDFKSLLRGSKSSGGDAKGSGDVKGSIKVMSISTFNTMSPKQQSEFMLNGGTLED